MTVKPREALPSTALTLPAEYYASREIFAKAQGRTLRSMWMYVGRFESTWPYSNREDLHYAFDRFIVKTLADC